MSRKQSSKEYWDMTTEQLREATKEFDQEFIADKAKPLTAPLKSRWQRAKAKSSHVQDGQNELIISVRLEKALLDRCAALAKKKRISRDALIARGLRAMFAAEGEG